MHKDWILTQEAFDALLAWLDPVRDAAGKKYEDIRRGLIKVFTCRGCGEPEDLADETINRVSNKLKQIADDFSGDPTRYFYGVANKVHLEYLRRRPVPRLPPQPEPSDDLEREFDCLEQCVQKLSSEHRNLVVQYYHEDKRAKIDHRRNLADQLGIGLNALRIRACRIRTLLQTCVQNCVSELTS
ncbi:MAG: hypothetical protein QOD33_1050 [Pyrinomonadaceae bacterium]|jgi:DNA-directed RNA polymerase specialized sigma24 family protein|nr:hypothetical protein [Pyrinomonadaceae bacterium]